MTPGFDVLGLGCTAVDELLYVDEHPPADGKAPVLRRVRQCGGLTSTALVAAARLGGRCAYAGVLGTDDQSAFVLKCLAAEKINTRYCVREPDARPIQSMIIVEERRQIRTVLYGIDHVRGAHEKLPDERVIRSSRVLFVDNFGIKGMIRAARIARNAGIPVVADFEGEFESGFRVLLDLADHLILSEEFAAKVGGIRALWNRRRSVVITTSGAKGCHYLATGMKAPKQVPAFRVQAVDTTGCGDVFHGAYALALARKMELPDRIRFAAAAAALKATRPGAQVGCPTLAAVEKFLKKARL